MPELGFEKFLKNILTRGGEKNEEGLKETLKVLNKKKERMTENTIAEAVKELLKKEKENKETPGKYDGRSISIARTKIEEAILIFKNEEKPSLFGMNKGRESDTKVVSLLLSAMLWLENSEKKPKEMQEEMERLSKIEVDPKAMLNYAIEGIIKASLAGKCR